MFTAANFDDGRELWKYEFAAPVADFEAPDTVCLGQPEYVSFSTFATGENWLWDFGADALPGTAQGKGPHDVKYTQAGTKTIHLIVSNPFGADTSTQILEVVTSVEPVFTFNQNGLIVSFINSSIGANSYFWQFGDGTTSTEPNPIHEYLQPGIYNVILEATNNCSSKSSMGTITPVSGSEEQSENIAAEIFPNPVYEQLWLNCPSCTAQTEFMVQDESGKIVQTGSVPIVSGTLTPLQVEPHLVSGVYYLILLTKHVQALPFFIQK
jgi:PKD repeat protein